MDGLEWKTLLRWMIWEYHYVRKHPSWKQHLHRHQVQVLVRASRVDEHQEMPERLFGDIGDQDLLRLSLTHGRAQRRLAADQVGIAEGNGRFGNKKSKILKTQVIHLAKFRFCW